MGEIESVPDWLESEWEGEYWPVASLSLDAWVPTPVKRIYFYQTSITHSSRLLSDLTLWQWILALHGECCRVANETKMLTMKDCSIFYEGKMLRESTKRTPSPSLVCSSVTTMSVGHFSGTKTAWWIFLWWLLVHIFWYSFTRNFIRIFICQFWFWNDLKCRSIFTHLFPVCMSLLEQSSFRLLLIVCKQLDMLALNCDKRKSSLQENIWLRYRWKYCWIAVKSSKEFGHSIKYSSWVTMMTTSEGLLFSHDTLLGQHAYSELAEKIRVNKSFHWMNILLPLFASQQLISSKCGLHSCHIFLVVVFKL